MENENFYAPVFRVKVNGNDLAVDVSTSIKQVVIDDKADSADAFTLTVDNCDLRWIDAEVDVFAEGNEVEIGVGYANGAETTLLGEITAMQVSFPSSGDSTLTVSGLDLSHRLMRGEKRRTFKEMKDSEIVDQIATEAQLSADADDTGEKLAYVVQENLSDYDFLKNRAKRLGYHVWVAENDLCFKAEREEAEPLVLVWKKSLVDFSPRITLANQVSEVEVRGWDPVSKKEFIGKATWDGIDDSGLSERAVDMIKAGGSTKSVRVDRAIHSQAQADEMAAAILKNITDTLITASGNCIGMPEMRVGASLELQGLGERFNGDYEVIATPHTLSDGGYRTSFEARKKIS